MIAAPAGGDAMAAQRGIHPGGGRVQCRGDLTNGSAVFDVQLVQLLRGDRVGWGAVGAARSATADSGVFERGGDPATGQPEAQRDLGDAQSLDEVQLPQSLGGWCGWAVPGRPRGRRGGPVQPRARMRSSTLESVTPSSAAISATRKPRSSRARTWSSVMVGCVLAAVAAPQRPPDGRGPSQRYDRTCGR